jgi:hypothetical protein
MNKPSIPLSMFSLLTALLAGCGSGGGGSDSSDFVGAAEVSMQATPTKIDSGDRTLVETEISKVIDSGIALKFRFPDSLRYVPESAFLYVNKKEVDLTPTVNQVSSEERARYVVFYIKQSLFAKPGRKYDGEGGTIKLQLEGVKALEEGKIEVDADVDDPAEDNATEFKIDAPEFVAEDDSNIAVASE